MPPTFREIRSRIRSVEQTRQIIQAMEPIAASRLLRAERRLRQARPFSDKISDVIRNLAATTENRRHPLLDKHEDAPTALLVITTDRGLAGAHNANVLRLCERWRRDLGPGRAQVYAIGRKADAAFGFRRIPVAEQWTGFSDNPAFTDAQAVGGVLIDQFLQGRIGSARIVYTEFMSMMVQQPHSIEILPVRAGELEGARAYRPVFEFEPEPSDILSSLLPMYVEMKVFHALLESAASEHAARRRAMSSASENADELITTLTRVANQARQSEITAEIAEALRTRRS